MTSLAARTAPSSDDSELARNTMNELLTAARILTMSAPDLADPKTRQFIAAVTLRLSEATAAAETLARAVSARELAVAQIAAAAVAADRAARPRLRRV